MRRAIVAADSADLLKNHLLSRICPTIGPALGEIDYLRGHKDDFLGDALLGEYSQSTNGAASALALLDGVHGGRVRLRTDSNTGDWAWLILGDIGGNYDSLDADNGWIQIMRAQLQDTADIYAVMHTYDTGGGGAGGNGYIAVGAHTGDVASDWMIRCHDGGAGSFTDSGVALDTDWHWHVADVHINDDGNKQVDYYLDGALIASQTTNISASVLTPALLCYALGDDNKIMVVDYWAVIPRELV